MSTNCSRVVALAAQRRAITLAMGPSWPTITAAAFSTSAGVSRAPVSTKVCSVSRKPEPWVRVREWAKPDAEVELEVPEGPARKVSRFCGSGMCAATRWRNASSVLVCCAVRRTRILAMGPTSCASSRSMPASVASFQPVGMGTDALAPGGSAVAPRSAAAIRRSGDRGCGVQPGAAMASSAWRNSAADAKRCAGRRASALRTMGSNGTSTASASSLHSGSGSPYTTRYIMAWSVPE